MSVAALIAALLVPLTASPSSAAVTFGAAALPFRVDGEAEADNVRLTWSPVAEADSYEIRRAEGGGAPTTVGLVPGTSYDDYDLGPDLTLRYTVRALAADGAALGESVPAEAVTFTPPTGLDVWDNTRPSSLAPHPSGIAHGGLYYRYQFATVDGAIRVTEQTSTDGFAFGGDRIVLTGENEPALRDVKLEGIAVVRNPATERIVIVAHLEEAGPTYTTAHLFLAGGTPGGAFGVTFNDRPFGNDSRDIGFFADADGSGYVLSATRGNQDLAVYRLTPDWSAPAEHVTTLFAGQRREAPALVKHDGHYYLFTSAAAGWYPSQPKYASAASIDGPWSEPRDIGNTATFGAQSGGVLAFGEHRAMMAHRWGANWAFPEPQHSTRLLPIAFNEGWASYEYFPRVDYDRETGLLVGVQNGRSLSVGKPAEASSLSEDAPGEDIVHAPERANDGTDEIAGNYYKSGAVPFSWQVDLEEASRLDRISLTWKMVNGSETHASYRIEGSQDGESWTTLVDASDNKLVGFTTHALEGRPEARFVRVTVESVTNIHNGNGAGWARGLNEVTVFGQPLS
ncbi:discoidin domain-containing protein [Streptomyces sp. NBRC 109706]|uniref:discoidin domain-containing protein n=1 Tax=Streptomyces sp. NBRC 109706 TaxID=1550035 RepID=UPI000781B53D|nr:discoidin domain-containing protein [Streptomyces sp. NBRC 109706]